MLVPLCHYSRLYVLSTGSAHVFSPTLKTLPYGGMIVIGLVPHVGLQKGETLRSGRSRYQHL